MENLCHWSTDIDLSKILNRNQQSNLDDYVEFEIFFDDVLTSSVVKNDTTNILTPLSGVPENVSAPEINPNSVIPHLLQNGGTKFHAFLYQRLLYIYNFIGQFISNYSWTCHPLFLEVIFETRIEQKSNPIPFSKNKSTKMEVVPAHLRGFLRLGDNIEEEWLVVYLLRMLSSLMEDISITIRDSDGDFLLIETAMHLPKWLNPNTSHNRVFIRRGNLHIIPRTANITSEMNEHHQVPYMPLYTALINLKHNQLGTYAAKPMMQKTIHKRLTEFEEITNIWCFKHALNNSSLKLKSSTMCAPHFCRVILPLPIALLLQRFPHLLGISLDHLPPTKDCLQKISKYYDNSHTPQNIPDVVIESKDTFSDTVSCGNNRFTALPIFDCSDTSLSTVMVRLRFNRCQFARMSQLHFTPPSRFTTKQWRLPTNANAIQTDAQHSTHVTYQNELERGAYICLGLLCAYILGHTSIQSIVAFFWAHSFQDNNVHTVSHTSQDLLQQQSTQTIEQLLQQFIHLLDRASQNSKNNNLLTFSKHKNKYNQSAPWINLTTVALQSMSKQAQCQSTLEQLDDIKFSDVFHTAYNDILECVVKSPESLMNILCTCSQRNSPKTLLDSQLNQVKIFGCSGLLCVQESDNTSWLSVSPKDLDEFIMEKTRDDRFRDALRKELQHKNPIISSDNQTKHISDTIVSPIIPSSNDQNKMSQNNANIDQELHDMFTKFKTLLHGTSGIDGVEHQSKVDKWFDKIHLSVDDKHKLKESLPEFTDLIDDLSDTGEQSILSSDTDEDDMFSQELDEETTTFSDNEFYSTDSNHTVSMKELFTAMDDELSTHTTHIGSFRNPINSQVEALSDNEEIENTSTTTNKSISFRDYNPTSLSDGQLQTILTNNFAKSQTEENGLNPGPVSLLYSYVFLFMHLTLLFSQIFTISFEKKITTAVNS